MVNVIAARGRAWRDAALPPETQGNSCRRILVITDEPQDATRLVLRLNMAGYETAAVQRALAPALNSLYSFGPDAVVLRASGLHSCRDVFTVLQKISSAPAIVIGQALEAQQIWYLEHGAAEYLVPPLSFALLHAHLRAILRCRTQAPRGIVTAGDLEVDGRSHEVRHKGQVIPLTPTEFRLLQVLAENVGRPCSHGMLLERVWGKQFTSCSNYLRLYITYLRQKLEDDPGQPLLIVTEWGLGYRLVDRGSDQRLPKHQATAVA
jgi:two-component system KDP operon response regulator KdpE